MIGNLSNAMLQDLDYKFEITNSSSDLRRVYEDLRQCVSPDNGTRRRIDACETVTNTVVDSALSRIQVRDEGQHLQEEKQ